MSSDHMPNGHSKLCSRQGTLPCYICSPDAIFDGGNYCEICGIDLEGAGSHYHCANCDEESSMMGHWVPATKRFTCEKPCGHKGWISPEAFERAKEPVFAEGMRAGCEDLMREAAVMDEELERQQRVIEAARSALPYLEQSQHSMGLQEDMAHKKAAQLAEALRALDEPNHGISM